MAKRKKTPPRAKNPATTSRLYRSGSNGAMSGFEPTALAAVPLPPQSKFPRMSGKPGQTLEASNIRSRKSTKFGLVGERNFAKALAVTGLLQRLHTAWSIPMPAADNPAKRHPRYKTDIDCAIATRRTLYLVDLKHYKAGDVTFRQHGETLLCVDNSTGLQVGAPRKMSHNMELAVELVQKHWPDANVTAVVVLIPTDQGEGAVAEGTCWPGGIPLLTLSGFLADLDQAAADTARGVNRAALAGLAALAKTPAPAAKRRKAAGSKKSAAKRKSAAKAKKRTAPKRDAQGRFAKTK